MAELDIVTPEELKAALQKELEPIRKALQDMQKPKEPSTYLTVTETADILKVTPFTVRSYTKKGILTRYKIGSRVRYKRSEVLEAIQEIKKPKIK